MTSYNEKLDNIESITDEDVAQFHALLDGKLDTLRKAVIKGEEILRKQILSLKDADPDQDVPAAMYREGTAYAGFLEKFTIVVQIAEHLDDILDDMNKNEEQADE